MGNEFKHGIDNKWAYLCYGAKYFEPTMKHIRAYLESSNERVTGSAKVTLYKGQIFVASTTSPYSLFNSSMATFDADLGAFNQNASPGFIELYNLAQKTSHAVGEQAKRKLSPASLTRHLSIVDVVGPLAVRTARGPASPSFLEELLFCKPRPTRWCIFSYLGRVRSAEAIVGHPRMRHFPPLCCRPRSKPLDRFCVLVTSYFSWAGHVWASCFDVR